jgi:hypothetical protein
MHRNITVRFVTSDRDDRKIEDTIGPKLLQTFGRQRIPLEAGA